MENKYVISVKRVRDYSGCHLEESKQYFEYAQIDDKGPMATGWPCLSSFYGAKTFNTVDDALAWWKSNRYVLDYGKNDYALDTLAVRKVIFKKVCNIDIDTDS